MLFQKVIAQPHFPVLSPTLTSAPKTIFPSPAHQQFSLLPITFPASKQFYFRLISSRSIQKSKPRHPGSCFSFSLSMAGCRMRWGYTYSHPLHINLEIWKSFLNFTGMKKNEVVGGGAEAPESDDAEVRDDLPGKGVDVFAEPDEPVYQDGDDFTEPLDAELYTVRAADLNMHPELSQQGVQLHDEVVYGSLWVEKWTTGEKNSTTKEAWPRKIEEVRRGVTITP